MFKHFFLLLTPIINPEIPVNPYLDWWTFTYCLMQYDLDVPLYTKRGHRLEFQIINVLWTLIFLCCVSNADPDVMPHFVCTVC